MQILFHQMALGTTPGHSGGNVSLLSISASRCSILFTQDKTQLPPKKSPVSSDQPKETMQISLGLITPSLVAQRLKNPPAIRKCGFEKIPWGREWQPTPIFSPGESHGQRSLVGYSSRGCKESDMTEHARMHMRACAHTHHYSSLTQKPR